MIAMDLNTGKQIEDLYMLVAELSRLCMGIPVKLYNEPSTDEVYVEWYTSGKNGPCTRYRMTVEDREHGGRGTSTCVVD